MKNVFENMNLKNIAILICLVVFVLGCNTKSKTQEKVSSHKEKAVVLNSFRKYIVGYIMLCLFFPFVFVKAGEGTVFNFSWIEKTDIALNLNDTIPFSYLDRRIIALSYLNDSIQANIMLDSGAPYLFLDSLFLPKVGLYTQPQSKEYFGSLESEGAVYYLLEKRNGENYWKSSLDLKTNGAVFQIDHPLCSNLSSFGVDGILGLRLLKRTNKIVNINMKDKFITYFLFLPDKYRSLPMTEDKYSSAPLVKLNIKVMTSGGIVEHSGMFMLDTG